MGRLKRIGLIAGLMAGLLQAVPAAAQPRPLTDTECQSLRARLAEHVKLSDGVRRAVATRAAASPAPPPPSPAVASTSPQSRRPGGKSRRRDPARTSEDSVERQQAEEGVSAPSGDSSSAAPLSTRRNSRRWIRSKARLSSSWPAAVAAECSRRAGVRSDPGARPGDAGPGASQRPATASAVRQQAAHDEPCESSLRELGAKEGQAGVVPLMGVQSQTAEQIARELGAQMPSAAPGSQVGLLDVNGDGRLDGFVDVPVKDVYACIARRRRHAQRRRLRRRRQRG